MSPDAGETVARATAQGLLEASGSDALVAVAARYDPPDLRFNLRFPRSRKPASAGHRAQAQYPGFALCG